MPILEMRDITKTFRIEDQEIEVLHNLSLSVFPGEFLVIKGSSGSGKSTLLSVMSGLDKPSSGRVFIEKKDITDTPEDDLAQIRNATFGFVFQSFHLVPSLTAIENIMFPAELKKDSGAGERAEALLRRVGMCHRKNNYPHQLSGGEKQRTAICRALINRPKIIFADEPTGNLDSENGAAILDLLMEFHTEQQTTLVMVTHSQEIAERADRVVSLADGRIMPDESGAEKSDAA